MKGNTNESKRCERHEGAGRTWWGTISNEVGLEANCCAGLAAGRWLRGAGALLWLMPLLLAAHSDRALGGGMGRLYGA
jgi:hypothetical protein